MSKRSKFHENSHRHFPVGQEIGKSKQKGRNLKCHTVHMTFNCQLETTQTAQK